MPNARNAKRKLYIWYKGAPTHPTQEIKHTHKAHKKNGSSRGGKKGSTPPAK
jgi:hypothetical protein